MFRNILVCVDDSPPADEALRQAIDLADCQRSRLTILAAVPRPPSWLATPMTVASVEPLGADLRAEAEKVLRRAVDRVPGCVPVTKILSEEPIRQALGAELRRCAYDLLVLGTHGRGPLAASLLRSLTRYAVRHCDIPVLVVRAEEGSAPASAVEPGAAAEAAARPQPGFAL
ncbi:MAG TPA: universal stress protein [Solirubrobacteraceae bacterium]|nr:universal stress protein [Solirubrobacteraceae bacterium]